jgi:hypothetical protein
VRHRELFRHAAYRGQNLYIFSFLHKDESKSKLMQKRMTAKGRQRKPSTCVAGLLLCARKPPPRLRFSMCLIERQLTRVKQTLNNCLLSPDELPLAASSGHWEKINPVPFPHAER